MGKKGCAGRGARNLTTSFLYIYEENIRLALNYISRDAVAARRQVLEIK